MPVFERASSGLWPTLESSPPLIDSLLDSLPTRDSSPVLEFASPLPDIGTALTAAERHRQETMRPAPMLGGMRELLELAGGNALERGDAVSSEHCASRATRADTDKAPPSFQFQEIAFMSDEEVASELADLLASDGLLVERRIMLFLARRFFKLGASTYGPIRLFDGRNNVTEMREEIADFLFYLGKSQLELEAR